MIQLFCIRLIKLHVNQYQVGITFSTHLRHSGFALQLHPFLRLQLFAILQIPQTTFALEFAISLIEIESEKDVIIVYYFEICHIWPIMIG